MDVIDMASKERAVIVTTDQRFVQKSQKYQGQRNKCLFRLLILPDDLERQKPILTQFKKGYKVMRHRQITRNVTWKDISDENLLVRAKLEDHPEVSD